MRRLLILALWSALLLLTAATASAQAVAIREIPDIPFTRLRAAAAQPIGLLFSDAIGTDYALPRPPLALIDLTTGAEIARIDGRFDYVRDALFSADATVLYTSHENGEIIAWDVATRTERARLTLPILTGYRLVEWDDTLIAYGADNGIVNHFLMLDIDAGAITRVLRIGQVETNVQFRELLEDFERRCELQIITAQAGERSLFGAAPLYAATASGVVLAIQADGSFTVIEPAGDPCTFGVRRFGITADGLIAYSFAVRDDQRLIAIDPLQGQRVLDLELTERPGALTVVPGTSIGYFIESTETSGAIMRIDLATGELTRAVEDEQLVDIPPALVELAVVGDGAALAFTLPTRNQLVIVDLP